jgi:hypothetical protein
MSIALSVCGRVEDMLQARASTALRRAAWGISMIPATHHYTCVKGLAQDLQDMAAEPGPFIQEAPAVVRPRHLPGHGEVPTADQPHLRDGVMRGGKGADQDQGGASAGEAGDADMMHASTPERVIIPSLFAPTSPKEPAGSDQLSTGHRFFVKPLSESLRLITLSRARGHQRAGTTVERRFVTHARAAGGMVWRREAVRGLPSHPATGRGGPSWTGRKAL